MDQVILQSSVLFFLSYLSTAGGEGMTLETGVISKQALFHVSTVTQLEAQTKKPIHNYITSL